MIAMLAKIHYRQVHVVRVTLGIAVRVQALKCAVEPFVTYGLSTPV